MRVKEPECKECRICDNGVVYTLETLMRQFGNDVLRLAYSYVKDRDTAERFWQQSDAANTQVWKKQPRSL